MPIIFGLLRAFGVYAIVEEGRCHVYVLFGKVLAVLDERRGEASISEEEAKPSICDGTRPVSAMAARAVRRAVSPSGSVERRTTLLWA